MSHQDTLIHLVAGGIGGTAGAVVTCPLEVVKTRLQSSVATFNVSPKKLHSCKKSVVNSLQQRAHICTAAGKKIDIITMSFNQCRPNPRIESFGIYKCLKYIIEIEGPRALFRGLGPNLIGVAPSRAIYFCSYSNAKKFLNCRLKPETPPVHVGSAAFAGFMASTTTNPIWFIKTRLQLDQRTKGDLSAFTFIRRIYRECGVRGFYKGITASYFGISETVIHFVIYEALKAKLREFHSVDGLDCNHKTSRDFFEFMCAGATSKTIASILAYPHEVARTRLREEGNKYRYFWQTLLTVFKEEGYVGLYRGLATQLVRQIPNTAIMMATYEAVVYFLKKDMYSDDNDGEYYDENG